MGLGEIEMTEIGVEQTGNDMENANNNVEIFGEVEKSQSAAPQSNHVKEQFDMHDNMMIQNHNHLSNNSD